ncbi:MAG: hypothetical protein ABIH23_07420 [bacterium]
MTFTWDATEVTTDLAKVRSKIGDTNSADQFLTDEQIEEELSENGDSVPHAIVSCIKLILAILARKPDRSGARFSSTRSQLFQHYKDMLASMEASLASSAGPSWSEHTESDADDMEDDDDFVQPSFKVGRDDNK